MTPETALRHASRRIPRYTSYPTSPHFGPIDERLFASWLRTISSDVSLYIHLPFCRSMCWYCGCHTTVAARHAPIARYIGALLAEIRLVAGMMERVPTVRHLHFGGGSPTLMRPEELSSVMAQLRRAFDIAPDCEIAIEVDPRTIEEDFAAAMAREGFSRASIGVQSFDPAVQAAINRVQSFDQTRDAISMLRRRGIAAFNFDLIYGLPLQDVKSCLETVDLALTLGPDRFAIFGYAHVPAFKRHQRRIHEADLADSKGRLDQAEAMADKLVAAGYERIGLDHFARPDDPLAHAARSGELHRNFQGYTTDRCDTLIGFGASAISRLETGYSQNCLLIGDYQDRLADGRLAVTRGHEHSSEDRLRGQVIERIMCDYRVDLEALGAAHLLDEIEIESLRKDGLIDREGPIIQVRPEARLLVRAVAAAFDSHLEAPTPRRHVVAV